MAAYSEGDSVITDQMCENWDTSGKNDLADLYKSIDEDEQVLNCGSNKDGKRIIYDLCWSVLRGKLTCEQAVGVLPELIAVQVETASMLMDVLAILELEVQVSMDEAVTEAFIQLQRACLSEISEEMHDLDCSSGIGSGKNSTKLVETQASDEPQKFKDLYEENDGYAKLICDLHQPLDPTVDSVYLIEKIKSLFVGFNLNPNRVLSIILESFQMRTSESQLFIPLLREYKCNENTLCEILGMKFKLDQDLSDFEATESLYTIAGLLIAHDLVSTSEIYHYLTPDDGEIMENNKKLADDAMSYARSLYTVSTVEKNALEEDNVTACNQCFSNQKLRLCETLLKLSDWRHAKQIIDLLPSYYAVSRLPIRSIIYRMLHITIDPLYRKYVIEGPSGFSTEELNGEFAPKPLESFADFGDSVLSMICSLGLYLHTDPVLMVKIARVTKAYLILHPNEVPGLEFDILTVIDEALLPSLSLLDCNCCMAEELWNLIQLYPYQYRYRLYGLWKNETLSDHPLIIRKKGDCTKKIKYIMKRISKENVAQSGRQIGKLSHSNPGCLFQYILSQIQTWDNLINPVVDSLKFLTNLSYDVLAYCIIEALGDPEKIKMTGDGTSISLWLQSLSVFCGAVFTKYSIELNGLLQYVANQLKAEKSADLIILKEIIYKMSGIETLEDITDDQLVAMTGGELLRYIGGSFNQVKNTKQSSQKLKDALLEQDLAIPMCLLMAQQRICILYKDRENSHIKLVGKLYDQCQNTLVQLGTFLARNFSGEDFIYRLPPIECLMGEYGISADVAFFLSRPMLNHKIKSSFLETQHNDRSYKSADAGEKVKKYLEVVSSVMRSSVESVRKDHPLQVWNNFSPPFYVTFWLLTTYDINLPRGSYDTERNKLGTLIAQSADNEELVGREKNAEMIGRYKTLKKKLSEEEKRQKDHICRVAIRLQSEKDSWFLSKGAGKNEMISYFLQLCVFPRCVFTPMDAIYCAQFIRAIHDLKTPNFPTLICYDRIFCDINRLGSMCTENEASCYGRFLCVALATVHYWHSSKEVFDKECWKYPGFVTRIADLSPTINIDYEIFRNLCYKWHCTLTKDLITCLESGNYIQIRNTLIILTKILPWFPYVANLSPAMEKCVEKVKNEEKDKRADLYALATGYSGQLKSMKPSMMPEQDFHRKQPKIKTPVPAKAQPDLQVKINSPNKALVAEGTSLDENSKPSVWTSAFSNVGNEKNKTLVLTKFKPDLQVKINSPNKALVAEGTSLDILDENSKPSVWTSAFSNVENEQNQTRFSPKSKTDLQVKINSSNTAIVTEEKSIEGASKLTAWTSAFSNVGNKQNKTPVPAKSQPDLKEKTNSPNKALVSEGNALDILEEESIRTVWTSAFSNVGNEQNKTFVPAKSKTDLQVKINSPNKALVAEEKSIDILEENSKLSVWTSAFSNVGNKQNKTPVPAKSKTDLQVKINSPNKALVAEGNSLDILEEESIQTVWTSAFSNVGNEKTKTSVFAKSKTDLQVKINSPNKALVAEGNSLDILDENSKPSVWTSAFSNVGNEQNQTLVPAKSKPDLQVKINSPNKALVAEGNALEENSKLSVWTSAFSKVGNMQNKTPVPAKSKTDLQVKINSPNKTLVAETNSLDILEEKSIQTVWTSAFSNHGNKQNQILVPAKSKTDLQVKKSSPNKALVAEGNSLGILEEESKLSVSTSALSNVGNKQKPSNSNSSSFDFYQYFSKIQCKVAESPKVTNAISTAESNDSASPRVGKKKVAKLNEKMQSKPIEIICLDDSDDSEEKGGKSTCGLNTETKAAVSKGCSKIIKREKITFESETDGVPIMNRPKIECVTINTTALEAALSGLVKHRQI